MPWNIIWWLTRKSTRSNVARTDNVVLLKRNRDEIVVTHNLWCFKDRKVSWIAKDVLEIVIIIEKHGSCHDFHTISRKVSFLADVCIHQQVPRTNDSTLLLGCRILRTFFMVKRVSDTTFTKQTQKVVSRRANLPDIKNSQTDITPLKKKCQSKQNDPPVSNN